jgi:hypothetical protein
MLAPSVALLRPDVSADAAAACLRGALIPGCHLLRVEPIERTATATRGGLYHARYSAHLDSPLLPPPGGYDLLVGGGQAPTRAPRAVWLRADDPTALRQVRVAHLSDLHVGKGGLKKGAILLAHLHEIIDDVNRLSPDLVIVTGDIVNSGQQPQLWPIAQELLAEVAAPVLVVLGNHDIEFLRAGCGRCAATGLAGPTSPAPFTPSCTSR